MASGMTSSEYIAHHLTNLTYGKHPVNGWSFAESGQQVAEMGLVHFSSGYLAAWAEQPRPAYLQVFKTLLK